ncbi:MAG TPA: metal ABC transporter substrate-binding protein [Actinomycetota bacterium]|nr:metal ABC transporter substrate-binding protein [Actinomycetota bacterium]
MRTTATLGRFAAVVAVLALIASACGSDEPGRGAGTGALHVVASFFPLAEASARIGGDGVEVENLTPPGVEPHDLELVPDDIEAIQSADVVVYVGGGFQPAVEDAAADAQGLVVDVLEDLPTRPADQSNGQAEDEHESERHGVDPHVWLDPGLFASVASRIANGFAEADPDDRTTYEANVETYRGELEALDEEFAHGLASCERTLLVTSHAAFGYLTTAYGLTQEPIAGIEPESEPGPARLAELSELVRREGVTTVFTEELVSPAVAETLASETGVQTAVLSTLEGAPEGGGDYGSAMRENLRTLRQALGCS